MENKSKIDNVVDELLELIPILFIMSDKFVTACINSKYQLHWSLAHLTPAVQMFDLRTEEQKAEDSFRTFCKSIYSPRGTVLYEFIVSVVKLYYDHTHTKIDVRALRIALRGIGISNFAELNQYADDIPVSSIVEEDVLDWKDIKNDIIKLEKDCHRAETTIDYQNIGNSCRNLLIKVAKWVYNPSIHGALRDDGLKIGDADAIGMLTNYFSNKLKGDKNKKLRAYAKATNDLANELTHKTTAQKQEMLLSVSATIHLVYIIGMIDGRID